MEGASYDRASASRSESLLSSKALGALVEGCFKGIGSKGHSGRNACFGKDTGTS
jgi:hypothetical protein